MDDLPVPVLPWSQNTCVLSSVSLIQAVILSRDINLAVHERSYVDSSGGHMRFRTKATEKDVRYTYYLHESSRRDRVSATPSSTRWGNERCGNGTPEILMSHDMC